MKVPVRWTLEQNDYGFLYRYVARYAGQQFGFTCSVSYGEPRRHTAEKLRYYRRELRAMAREHVKIRGLH